jgi:hypothetical protein
MLPLATTVRQVDNCQIHIWYPKFRKVTFTSEFIPLSSEFLDYLKEDGIYFPENSKIFGNIINCDNVEDSADNSQWSPCMDEKEDEGCKAKVFPDLEQTIDCAIQRLGGKVFPKLNWRSPKDAAWISTTGNLRCTNAKQIILLLKSSDRIIHDVDFCYCECIDWDQRSKASQYYLCLRKWHNLNPSQEFRCYVYNRSLVGISQRDCHTFYPFLSELQTKFKDVITQFFIDEICQKFPDPNFVFDVYVTREWKVWLIDFAPFAETTDPLLFTWNEIFSLCHSSPKTDPQHLHTLAVSNSNNSKNNFHATLELRLVNEMKARIQPNVRMLASRFPLELAKMSLECPLRFEDITTT